MKIEATTTFLDGIDRFEVGDIRTVDDARGERLVAAGWAREFGTDPTAATPVSDLTLEIEGCAANLGDSNG